MADEKSNKAVLPRIRVTSQSFADHSNIGNVSLRTVSSSSIISTPSNNIRRVQQQNLQKNPRPKSRPDDSHGMRSTARTSKKLLNLLQLKKKANTQPKPFVLRKPANLSKYDYSVFIDNWTPIDEHDLLPPVKESQIKAWESAEKISANIIFDHDMSASSDAFAIFDDADKLVDSSYDEDTCAGDDPETSINRGTQDKVTTTQLLILSIPGYTKGELKVIMDNFAQLLSCSSQADFTEYNEKEEKALWLYRQQQSAAQEKAFMAYRTLSGKRKVQIHHKKEFLHKLFGYLNNLNQEHITNNTLYSAVDNVANAQKAFHEDKDEIFQLLEADKEFQEALDETRKAHASSFSANGDCDSEFDPVKLLEINLAWLTSTYHRQLSSNEFVAPQDGDPEVVACTVSHLKRCVREDYDRSLD